FSFVARDMAGNTVRRWPAASAQVLPREYSVPNEIEARQYLLTAVPCALPLKGRLPALAALHELPAEHLDEERGPRLAAVTPDGNVAERGHGGSQPQSNSPKCSRR
ncbi:MAG: hypothetical protein ACRDHX_06965, partial [Chloroflexota bacterium]